MERQENEAPQYEYRKLLDAHKSIEFRESVNRLRRQMVKWGLTLPYATLRAASDAIVEADQSGPRYMERYERGYARLQLIEKYCRGLCKRFDLSPDDRWTVVFQLVVCDTDKATPKKILELLGHNELEQRGNQLWLNVTFISRPDIDRIYHDGIETWRKTVRARLIKEGVLPDLREDITAGYPGVTNEQLEEAKRMRAAGYSDEQIAAKFNLATQQDRNGKLQSSTVRAWRLPKKNK